MLGAVSFVHANTTGITRQIFPGVNVVVDGREIPLTGDEQAFIMEGTTFLPVGVIARELGIATHWDGATRTMSLGDIAGLPNTMLHNIQFTNVRQGGNVGFRAISTPVTDSRSHTFSEGMTLLGHGSRRITDNVNNATTAVDYPLNSQYQTMAGTIVLAEGGARAVDVVFIGDGRILHRANHVTNSMSHNFDFSISGVNLLTIELVPTDFTNNSNWTGATHTAHLVNVGLFR